MDCKDFENHIHEYFSNPDFDWKLKIDMDAHYFECDKCYNTYRVTELLSNKEVMADVSDEVKKMAEAKVLIEHIKKFVAHGDVNNALQSIKKIQKLDIKNKDINDILGNILTDSWNVRVNEQKIQLKWFNGRLVSYISSFGEGIIKFAGKNLKNFIIKENNIYLSRDDLSLGFTDKDIQRETLYDDTDVLITIQKGYNKGKIEICFK